MYEVKEAIMIEIKFIEEENRVVAYDDKVEIGECEFIIKQDTWNIIHTEVNRKYQGQGIARKMVECVIKNANNNNKNLIASCSYAKIVIDKKVTIQR